METWFIFVQRHDIIKKRIDAHGNVIETRQDGIGAPKVSNKFIFWYCILLYIFFLLNKDALKVNLHPCCSMSSVHNRSLSPYHFSVLDPFVARNCPMKKYYMPGLKNLTPNSITKPKFLLCQLSYLPSNISLMLVQSLEILLCNVIWNLIIFSYS